MFQSRSKNTDLYNFLIKFLTAIYPGWNRVELDKKIFARCRHSSINFVMEPIEWSPTFHAVDLSLLPLTLPPSLVSMAAQEVMKHYTILEEAARNWLDGDYESCVRLTKCWQDSRLEYGVSLESCQYLVSFDLAVKPLITCWTLQLQTKSGEVNVSTQHLVTFHLWRGWTCP